MPPTPPTGPPPDRPTSPSADRPTSRPAVPPLVPALPPRLADPILPAVIGTVLWFAASLVLFAAYLFGPRSLDELFWTTTAGWLIGLFGYSVFRWQRAAARRGSRSAQRGLGPR